MMMFVVVCWQFGLVAPWGKLMLFVSVRWAPPNLDVDTLVSSHSLIVAGEHQEEGQEDGASREDGLKIVF